MSAGIDSVASPQPVRLDPISIEAIARRVAELLGQDVPLLDAAAVARRLGRAATGSTSTPPSWGPFSSGTASDHGSDSSRRRWPTT